MIELCVLLGYYSVVKYKYIDRGYEWGS